MNERERNTALKSVHEYLLRQGFPPTAIRVTALGKDHDELFAFISKTHKGMITKEVEEQLLMAGFRHFVTDPSSFDMFDPPKTLKKAASITSKDRILLKIRSWITLKNVLITLSTIFAFWAGTFIGSFLKDVYSTYYGRELSGLERLFMSWGVPLFFTFWSLASTIDIKFKK